MLVYPGMLVGAAEQAGMKVPPNVDQYDPTEYPHFDLFCLLQLARRMQWGEQFGNAKILAAIPIEELHKMTVKQLVEEKGFAYPL